MSRPRVLVVDDEHEVRNSLSEYFSDAGFDCRSVADGLAALSASNEFNPNCVILDLNLPLLDGFEVLKELRKYGDVPVIILSGRTDEVDRVLGLEMGADDYVTKPYSPRELLARVKAVLRRVPSGNAVEENQAINIPGFQVNRLSREVKMANQTIELTPKEFDLLWFLACNRNRVFTRSELLEKVWSYLEFFGDERTVDQHIKRLRKKLHIEGSPCRIATIWGVGYKFELTDNGVPV